MTIKETLTLIPSLMPAIIGGAIGVFALVGLRELLKEARLAFKRTSVSA